MLFSKHQARSEILIHLKYVSIYLFNLYKHLGITFRSNIRSIDLAKKTYVCVNSSLILTTRLNIKKKFKKAGLVVVKSLTIFIITYVIDCIVLNRQDKHLWIELTVEPLK